MNPEQQESEQKRNESRESSIESKEDLLVQGAEMLEEPQSGSFMLGLQTFITWVKSIVAPNDKP